MKIADATMLYCTDNKELVDAPKFFVVRFTYLTTNRGEDISDGNNGSFSNRRAAAVLAFYDSLNARYQHGNPDNFKRSPSNGYFNRAVLIKGWAKLDRIDIEMKELKV